MKVGLVVLDENPADALRIVRAADRAGVRSRTCSRQRAEPDRRGLRLDVLPRARFRLRQKITSPGCITDDAG